MKENKKAIEWLIVIIIISFVSAILLEWKWDKTLLAIMQGHRSFVINVFLSVFAGGILATITAIITYRVKRKEMLNDYYIILSKHIQNINFLSGEITSYNDNNICAHLKGMSTEIKALQFNYTDLVSLKSKISLFNNDTKIRSCLDNANRLLGDLNLQLTTTQYFANGWKPPSDSGFNGLDIINPDNKTLVELKKEQSNLQNLLGITITTHKSK